eukprot:GHVS01054516.1.p1 GENE.GHVS01054516.1~~GHVS01054516.1.p1  ORF type:complete len:350 (-),score=47.12 GHVS01054516.1:2149-3198(-)
MELLSQLCLPTGGCGCHPRAPPPHGCRVWLVNYCVQETSDRCLHEAASSFCRLVARIPFTRIYLPEEEEAMRFLSPLLNMEQHLSARVCFDDSLRARGPEGPDGDAIRFVQGIEAEGLQTLPEEPPVGDITPLYSIVPRDTFWYPTDTDDDPTDTGPCSPVAAGTTPTTPISTDTVQPPLRPITTTTPRGQQQAAVQAAVLRHNNAQVSLQIRWTARTFVERVWTNWEFGHSQVLVLAGHSILFRMIPVFINRDMNNRLKPGGVTVITVCPVDIDQPSIEKYADFLQVDAKAKGSHEYPRNQQRQQQPIAPFRDRPHNPRPFDNGTCSFFEVYNDRTYLDEDFVVSANS